MESHQIICDPQHQGGEGLVRLKDILPRFWRKAMMQAGDRTVRWRNKTIMKVWMKGLTTSTVFHCGNKERIAHSSSRLRRLPSCSTYGTSRWVLCISRRVSQVPPAFGKHWLRYGNWSLFNVTCLVSFLSSNHVRSYNCWCHNQNLLLAFQVNLFFTQNLLCFQV